MAETKKIGIYLDVEAITLLDQLAPGYHKGRFVSQLIREAAARQAAPAEDSIEVAPPLRGTEPAPTDTSTDELADIRARLTWLEQAQQERVRQTLDVLSLQTPTPPPAPGGWRQAAALFGGDPGIQAIFAEALHLRAGSEPEE